MTQNQCGVNGLIAHSAGCGHPALRGNDGGTTPSGKTVSFPATPPPEGNLRRRQWWCVVMSPLWADLTPTPTGNDGGTTPSGNTVSFPAIPLRHRLRRHAEGNLNGECRALLSARDSSTAQFYLRIKLLRSE